MKILFYDTETTGMPLWDKPSEGDGQPHIVELAAALVDAETNEDIALLHSLAYPMGWSIPEEATETHGITTEYATEVGASESLLVSMFLALWANADIRVAHNESFDARIIRIATKRHFSEQEQADWKAGAAFCTMRKSTDICQIPNTNGRKGYKFPKLSEAYRYFVGEDMPEKHRALPDMRACQAVYQALSARGATPCSK